MADRVQIDDFRVSVVLRERGRSIDAELLIEKPAESEPLEDEAVGLVLESEDGTLLRATGWPDPGVVPEARIVGVTASAMFRFERQRRKPPVRAIAVVRGTFGEIDLRDKTTP